MAYNIKVFLPMNSSIKTSFDHGGNVFAISRTLGVSPEDILDFSASINPLGPAPGVREALAMAFNRVVHYPDSDSTELRETLAERHGMESANICVANGSTQLIYLLSRLTPGKRALVVAPAFSEYARALARDGWGVEQFVLETTYGFDFPLDRLEKSLSYGYELLILGNPGNPTGRLYSIQVIEAIYRLCQTAGCVLVLDEAFMDFCEEGSAKHLAAKGDGILVLRSLTKFYALPGVRLGYAIGNASNIALLSLCREPWSVNTPAQAAGLASLADAGYAAATRKLILSEREYLFNGLEAISGLSPYPSSANYLLVEIVEGPTSRELAERLLAGLILIRCCSNFAGLDDRFFRVAIRKREDNDRLLGALSTAVSCPY
jgi:threonine-phosphate decarboxylase